MKTTFTLALLLTISCLRTVAAMPGPDDTFAGKLTDYRIKDPHTLVIRCDAVRIVTLNASKVELFKIKDEIVVYPSVAEGSLHYDSQLAIGTDPSFLSVTFPQYSFEPGEDYELRFAGKYINGPGGPDIKFALALLRFSAASNFAVVPNLGQATVRLFSRVALNDLTGATLLEKSTSRSFGLAAAGGADDFDAMGNALIVPAPTAVDPRQLAVSGITDVLGAKPGVKPGKPIAPPAAPKDRDASAWYLNFLHQAGVGAKPAWIVNGKIAPVFGDLPGGHFLVPSLDVDIGQGQVGKTKTNDIINPKIGVTRLVRTRAGILENLQYTPAFSYETNRKFDKRNALFDGDIRFYLSNLQNTRGERSQEAFFKARQTNKKILPQDVPKAFFGYSIKLFLGTELGGALTNNDVKSSDKSSQVTVPKYGIRRLRPRISGTFEFQRVTAGISFVPRYLFSAENVSREIDTLQPSGKITKTVVVSTVSGWRPYAEFSLSYSIDPLGHYSLVTVYKRGSLPPNFDRTNTVQSGILVRF